MVEIYMKSVDYNVPYEISLKEAINKGIPRTFLIHYGIFDNTLDYSKLHGYKGRKELNETLYWKYSQI